MTDTARPSEADPAYDSIGVILATLLLDQRETGVAPDPAQMSRTASPGELLTDVSVPPFTGATGVTAVPPPTRPDRRSPAATPVVIPDPLPAVISEPRPPAPARDAGARARVGTEPSRTRLTIEWVVILGGALLIALVLKVAVVESFSIPSESMHPTLQRGDRVLVNKLAYLAHEIRRGDVIVFKRPADAPAAGPNAPADLIKRVIGLPGETVTTRDGIVYIDGRALEEPYLPKDTTTLGLDDGVTIPAGKVFVMGDNRGNSADSRVFGPISTSTVIGRAFARVWPAGRVAFL